MPAGGCFCGEVRYRTDAAPFNATLCHCATCRRIAGAVPVAWFSVPAAAFAFTAGEPVRFASSACVERTHCGRCGTTLTYRTDSSPDEIDVTIASLDEPDAVPPRDHTQADGALAWDVIVGEMPVFPRSRSGT